MQTNSITPSEAKKVLAAELNRRQFPYTKLTAKTISFVDLARASSIYVKIHGWAFTVFQTPEASCDAWAEMKLFAKNHGFFIE